MERPITNPDDCDVVRDGIAAATKLGVLISVRLDPEMARLVQLAARAEGVTLIEFVRRAALQAATAVVAREPVTDVDEAPPGA